MTSGGYPLIYITEPNRGQAELNIAPGDHTIKRYPLTEQDVLSLTASLLAVARTILGDTSRRD